LLDYSPKLKDIMKPVLLFVALWMAPVVGRGQVVDGKAIDQDPAIRYVKMNVVDAGKFGKVVYRITLDYGQQPNNSMNFTVLDEKGDARLWVSEMEALNYMAGLGWELVLKTQTSVPGTNRYLDAYILKKK
jgi:hypothetical protein